MDATITNVMNFLRMEYRRLRQPDVDSHQTVKEVLAACVQEFKVNLPPQAGGDRNDHANSNPDSDS